MTTPNIIPRADTEGSIGTAAVRWGDVYISGDISDGTDAVSPSEAKDAYDHSVLTSGNPHAVTYTEAGADAAGTAAAAVASHEGLYDHTEIGNASTIQSVAVSATGPNDGQALVYSSGNAQYEPTTISTLASVTTDTTLDGDGTAGNALGLADTAVTPGSYVLASVTVDQQGRATSVTSGTVANDGTISGDGTAGDPLSVVNDGHTHTNATISGYGTAALKDAPTLGNDATTAQVVVGDDSRLDDARTPTAHKTTHESGGSDEVLHDNLDGYVAGEHILHSSVTVGVSSDLTYVSGTGTIDSSMVIGLSDTGATAGSYSLVGLTVDGKGRISSVSSVGVATSAEFTGDGTSGSPVTLAVSGATAGSYVYSGLTVDSKGRITSVVSGDDPNDVVEEFALNTGTYGFADRSETSIGFNDSTYTFTITDAGSGWTYYRAGVKCTVSGNKTVVLAGAPPTKATYYVSIDNEIGTLSYATTPWALSTETKVPVAIICWDNSLTPKYCLADERHEACFSRDLHAYRHLTAGTQYESGAAISGYTVSGTTDADNTYALSECKIWDEDYRHTLSALSDGGTYHIEYRTAASTWAWVEQAIPFRYTAAGYIQWDNAGTMTQGSASKYYVTYIMATNGNANARFVVVHGQAEYANLAAAQAATFSGLSINGLQYQEGVALWKLIWETSNSYSTTGKCRLAVAPIRIQTSLIQAGSSIVATDPIRIGVACSDETTALTVSTARVTFRTPCAINLTAVRASVTTAPTGASMLVDINEGGTTILSTKLMIDAGEKTSTTATTPYVFSDTALADDAEITVDIDQVGSTVAGAGLKVWLIGTRA